MVDGQREILLLLQEHVELRLATCLVLFGSVVALRLLLHVVDISHPDFEEQIRVVEKTLQELGCAEKPSMIVFNKIDAYTWVEKEEDDLTPATKENVTLDELKSTWMAKMAGDCLFISAREKQNIDELREVLYKRVRALHVQKYPYNDFLYNDIEESE